MLSKALLLAASSGYNQTWNLDNFSYLGTPMNIGRLDALYNPRAMFFKPDGTKIYTVTSFNVYEHSLSTAWDISTVSHVTSAPLSGVSTPTGLFFSSDGLLMYITDETTSATIRQYDLSSAWDISSATYTQNFSIAATGIEFGNVFFSPDGLNMYVTGTAYPSSTNYVHQYTLSTAWDISTASSYLIFSVTSNTTKPLGLFFSSDGSEMYVLDEVTKNILQYTLSTAWDLTTASYNTFIYASVDSDSVVSIFLRPTGGTLYVLDWYIQSVRQFSLGTVWDISTASYQNPTTRYLDARPQDSSTQGLFFKPDGTKLFIMGGTNYRVYEYSLSSPWDFSTVSYVQNFSVSAQETSPKGLFFSSDGLNMYVVGYAGDDVNQYSLSTAWDISTATYLQRFSVTGQTANPSDIFFRSDGTKMYVTGNASDTVNEYSLPIAWDISTAIAIRTVTFSISNISGVFFKPDGTKMYLSDDSLNGNVKEYSLSTAWDISTASLVRTITNSNTLVPQQRTLTGLGFNTLGSRLYVLDANTDSVWQYDLT